jgi:capsular polysaccharide biosynthesis protein/predicted nucleic acid-binding protein
MDVASVWKALRKRWLIVACATVTLATIASILTLLRPPTYTTTAEGLVSISHPQNRPPWELANGSQYITDRMPSYAHVGGTDSVILPVYARLHLGETLRGHVVSQWVADKALLRITVTDSDPKLAARIADDILQQLGSSIEQIENGNVLVTEITPAPVPAAPSNHNVLLNSAVGAAAGLLIGLFGAVGLQMMSDRSRRRRLWRTWVMDASVYTHFWRAGHASLIPQLAPGGRVLVPTYAATEIDKDKALHPGIPSVDSVRWAQAIRLNEEEDRTQIQVKAQMGGSNDEYLPESAVIACALHRDMTAVLGHDDAIEQAHRLGVRTCGILWIVVEAYETVYDGNRGLAAALVDDLLAAGVQLPFDSGEELFTWAHQEGLLEGTAGEAP